MIITLQYQEIQSIDVLTIVLITLGALVGIVLVGAGIFFLCRHRS